MQYTDLSRAKLFQTQLNGTNLTGACIEDWSINSKTNLRTVICDYIYLEQDQRERRPSDPHRSFEPGEFAKLVEESLQTVDLIFKNGIDWQAFLTSYKDLQVEYGDNKISIQAIEKKSNGAFVIRLDVPPEIDKAEIESYTKQSYETEIKVLEAENRLLLKQNANLENIVNTLASRTIIVKAEAIAESKSMSDTFNNDLKGSNIANFANQVKDNAQQQANHYNYTSEKKQTLAEAAAEIQKLLKQLDQTNPAATVEQQQAYVDAAIPRSLKDKCVDALLAGGETAMDEFFLDNPYIQVGKAIVKSWIA